MKVAVAQIGTDPGCFEDNENKIIASIESAKAQGASLVVFPEATIQGYAHLDLVFNPEYVNETRRVLERVASSVRDIVVILGFVDSLPGSSGPGGKPTLFNSAAVLQDGAIKYIRDKTLLPEYDVFTEHRYFTPGTRIGLLDINGKRVGVGICEDMWSAGYRVKVYPELIRSGAEILVNLSASPFHVGKQAERTSVISEIIRDSGTAFIYCNAVGSYDGYDGEIVFDGQSSIWGYSGSLIKVGKAFTEQVLIADIDLDEEKIDYREVSSSEEDEIYGALILGIKEYFRRGKFERAYVGLSGGIDSALVASLCVAALGPEAVIGVTMPSHITSEATYQDAEVLAKNLNIKLERRSIVDEFNAWLSHAMQIHGTELDTLTRQNKQARIRGSILMEYSNQDPKGIVVSTGNKTELALGYCTLYGDMCGGFAAISDLSKERVYALSRHINSMAGFSVIPESTINRPPTAELEENQTDAANLPADYDVVSPLVDDIIDGQLSKQALSERYDIDTVEKTLRLIRINEFKRRQAAPGIRVTQKAFGIGRRIPMMHCFD